MAVGGLKLFRVATGLRHVATAITEVQAASISKLGYTPVTSYNRSSSVIRVEVSHPQFKSQLGFVNAEISPGGTRLDLQNVGVVNANNYRKGLSEFMMAEVVKRHPRVREIESTLAMDNLAAAKSALGTGVSCVEAIKQTPAYKMRAKLGFTQILNPICGETASQAWKFTVARPG